MNQSANSSKRATLDQPKKQRLCGGSDLREAALLAGFRVAVATSPVSQWNSIADRAAQLEKGPHSKRFKRFAARVRAVLDETMDNGSLMHLWRRYHATMNRRRISVMALRYAPQWRPRIEIEGRKHLDAAIAAGRGTILWFDSFVHHSVIGKRAFFEQGYRAWQMSSLDHGFSRSRFACRFLNPIQLAVEAPYILGRIQFDAGSALAATRRASASLAGNEIVRITNNAYIGRQRFFVPFGSASLPVATAPLNMGRRSGAAILPVAVIERQPFEDYLVTIAPPIVLDPAAPREACLAQAAEDYAHYLKPLVAAYPNQWRGWEGVQMKPAILFKC